MTRYQSLTYARLLFCTLKKIVNPASNKNTDPGDKQPAYVGVHEGFYRALNAGPNRHNLRASKISEDEIQIALDYHNVAKAIKDLNLVTPEKGYTLYVTGHSLGAALATLFGYTAAADDVFVCNGPVTIYSYASPRVGDSRFQQSFQLLEKAGRLRHARIRNHFDKGTADL